ncbi:hypothetical protein HMPREF6745_2392 [Prevotella sp. oral taxon 472 str. F0295]|nr:hypothetical protein HMPREF6745_2392 [Prevotella sp. oral taxon 472 str. F0295]
MNVLLGDKFNIGVHATRGSDATVRNVLTNKTTKIEYKQLIKE